MTKLTWTYKDELEDYKCSIIGWFWATVYILSLFQSRYAYLKYDAQLTKS